MRWSLAVALLVLVGSTSLRAQDSRLVELERRVGRLEADRARGDTLKALGTYLASGGEVVGVALFCGFWARSTGRDFWLWMSAGLVFNLIMLLVIWSAASSDQKAMRKPDKVPEI